MARATLRLWRCRSGPDMAARCARNLAEGLLLISCIRVAMAKLGCFSLPPNNRQAKSFRTAGSAGYLHAGDPVLRSVIGRAVRAGADPLFQRRHLPAGIKMQEGYCRRQA